MCLISSCSVDKSISELVDFLNSWSRATTGRRGSSRPTWHTTSRHAATWHTTWGSTSCSLVEVLNDGVADLLDLLLRHLVRVQPLDALVALVLDLLLVRVRDGRLHLLLVHGGLHVEAVGLEPVLGADPLALLLVLRLVLLCLVHHLLDVLLGQAALVVGDRDLVLLSSWLVGGRHVEDTIGVNVKGNFNLRHTTRSWRDAGQLELAEHVVVLGHGALALVDLDQHSRLVVRVGGEGLGLLGGDGGVPLDQRGHHPASRLDAKGEGADIKEEKILHLLRFVSTQDGCLDSSSVGHGLVRVDRLVQLLSAEEVLQQFLNLGNSRGSSNKNDFVDVGLVHLGVPQRLLNRVHGASEEVSIELLKPRPGDRSVEIDAFEERVDLDRSLSRGRESSLSTLASRSQTTQGTLVPGEVLLVLPLKLGYEVVDHPVVEVLATKVGVSTGRLHLKDAVLDGEDGHIKGAATEVIDQHMLLPRHLLVQAVGDGGSSGLVDDPEHVQAGDDPGVLGGLPLRVVEVCRHSDDGVGNGIAKIGLGSLLHLDQHHGGDLLGVEQLLLTHEVHLELGLSSLVDDFKGPLLHVALNGLVVELASNQPLRVEDSVGRVHRNLVLGGVPDQPLSVGEADVGGGCSVALVVRDDLNLAMLEDTDTGVGCPKVDSHGVVLTHLQVLRHCPH